LEQPGFSTLNVTSTLQYTGHQTTRNNNRPAHSLIAVDDHYREMVNLPVVYNLKSKLLYNGKTDYTELTYCATTSTLN